MPTKPVTLIYSGGLDSTVLLYHLAKLGTVHAVSINYGQRHAKEIEFASLHTKALGVKHDIVDLSAIGKLLPGSSQTDLTVPVPEGHYAAESMKATVVPNRNMLMLAAAAAISIANGGRTISYAAHAGDHAIYPDCRPTFARAMRRVLSVCDFEPVVLRSPFIKKSKADIVRRGFELRVPLDRTWSCYVGGEKHCGKCGTCVERIEAFALSGVADWTDYANPEAANIGRDGRQEIIK